MWLNLRRTLVERNQSIGNMTWGSIHLRRATLADTGTIAHILLISFESFRPLYTEGGFSATTPSAEVIAKRFDEGPAWLAVDRGEALGTVSAVALGDRVYLRSMAVLPSARGRGAGTALLHEVEEFALKRRARSMYLSTTPFLHNAIRLYEEFGFHRTEEGPHDLAGTALFSMEKSLTTNS
jgi:GNAT superfamily N-acetyltransferase